MFHCRGACLLTALLVGFSCGLTLAEPAHGQTVTDDFTTGRAAQAWELWVPAMEAVLDRDQAEAERRFGELLELDPSTLRIALLADRTVRRTALGGAVLLLEQDYASEALGDNAARIAEMLETGREQMNEADDGWYFCTIGRFDVANANFEALLNSDPDPVAFLELTDRDRRRRQILVSLTDHPVVGESCRKLLRLLERGEELVKSDPTRIRVAIRRLADSPRAYENARDFLKQAGEYAVPFIIEALRDPARQDLTLPLTRVLPLIDRDAVNPLVYGIRIANRSVQTHLIRALGQIGYAQAFPYLLKLSNRDDLGPDVRAVVDQAINQICSQNAGLDCSMTAAEAFFWLGERYYADDESLQADPRLDTANVWYWREDILQNIEVPTEIFNEVMAMRCCEEALLLDEDMRKAQALWVAANFRRAAQLGENEVDRTRPENFPSPKYFAQTAGPAVCLMSLNRALADGDPAVALGVIEALGNTAGRASLVASEEGRGPLAAALAFPDRMVRIQAALTLGRSMPTEEFSGYQNLMPVLAEALRVYGGQRTALVVDPEEQSANRVAGLLRAAGYEVAIDSEFYAGLEKARAQLAAVDVIILSSQLPELDLPAALQQLRSEFRFGSVPVLLLAKRGDRERVNDLARADHRLGEITPQDEQDQVEAVIERISRAVGITPITPEVGLQLALATAETLEKLALTDNPLVDLAGLADALLTAFETDDGTLKRTVGRVLTHICTRRAQETLAEVALAPESAEQLRIDMFALLAESAKRCGNLLGESRTQRVIEMAQREGNMALRTAASQALGALNLPAEQGGEIIRNQYDG